MRRLAQIVAVGLAVSLGATAMSTPALGDADPASDILLGTSAFYPFEPPVSQALQTQLQQQLAQLQKQGLGLKVAIIESPVDLGALPNMFGQPQTYAKFLDQEISFNHAVPLLVVMPQGFGVANVGPASALSGLTVNAAGRSDGLAQSAIEAVQKLAQANGKALSGAGSGAASGSGSGGPSLLLTVGLPVLLVLMALGIAAVRYRRSSR